MNALQSYSSDDESAEEFSIQKMPKVADPGTNYDDVGMDISEDSGDNAEATDNETTKRDSFTSNNVPSKPPPSSSVKSEPTAGPLDNHRKGSSSSSSHLYNELDKKDSFDKGRRSNSLDKVKDDRHSTSGSKRDKDKDKEKEKERSSASSREAQRESRDHKDSRRVSDGRGGDHRKGGRSDDRRSSRRSRSRSRDRGRRSRSRSRSRDRDRRRRRSRSRSRSRSRDRDKDRDRRRPHEIRKEAQQKLAAFKACNPNFDHNELLKRGMEAQFAEVQKNTGVTLPSYYNPATMNPLKIAEQERKKKLLWGNKVKADSNPAPESSNAYVPLGHGGVVGGGSNAGLWVNTTFSNDSDGKMAEKFKRLMGVKAMGASSTGQVNAGGGAVESVREGSDLLQKQESMFSSMEKQYEMARLATHTHKGFGLGFSSQTYLPKP